MKDVFPEDVDEAAGVIAAGGVVAFPTETYYGLAVDPFNEEALLRLYRLKKREHSKPLLTLINQRNDLGRLVDHVPQVMHPFMEFWPAPLTLVLPARHDLSPILTGGTGTVGVRISAHPVAHALILSCTHPVTATSANISGMPPCTSVAMIESQFTGGLDYILDGGTTPGGKGSTLVALHDHTPVVLRQGLFPLASFAHLL